MTPWEKVVVATSLSARRFKEPWEFTDHIRRIVFAAVSEAIGH